MNVKIKETSTGFYSLVATTNIPEGACILKLEGKILDKPTRYSIEIGEKRHIVDYYGSFINHSFSPTATIVDGCVVSCTEIKRGDQITFDYNKNETRLKCPFIDNDSGCIVEGKNAPKRPGSHLFARYSLP